MKVKNNLLSGIKHKQTFYLQFNRILLESRVIVSLNESEPIENSKFRLFALFV